jgi:hypothetical protein
MELKKKINGCNKRMGRIPILIWGISYFVKGITQMRIAGIKQKMSEIMT